MIRLRFLVCLPFRIRLGELYRQSFQFKGKSFEVVLYNRTRVLKDSQIHEIISETNGNHDLLWTEALIIIKQPKIKDENIERLKVWTPDQNQAPPIDSGSTIFQAMQALNYFILAYATGAKQIFGGKALCLFRTHDFMDSQKWEIAIYCPLEKEFTDDEYKEAFDSRLRHKIKTTGQITGDLYDLSIGDVKICIEEYLVKLENFIHFELASEAKSKMLAGDYIGALLMAVAALEGAHAAFVQFELKKKLPKNKQSLSEEFIKELGMTLCNQLTPYLLMEENERPAPDIIQKVKHGLKIRNEIMHSLQNKRGEFRLRTRTNKEISDAYSAVLKAYECYVHTLETRSNQTATPN